MMHSDIRSDPCKSAPSAKSAFYRRTDPRTKSTDGKVSAFICVHPRFFYDVTFQTGWTGYDFESEKFNSLKYTFKDGDQNNKSICAKIAITTDVEYFQNQFNFMEMEL